MTSYPRQPLGPSQLSSSSSRSSGKQEVKKMSKMKEEMKIRNWIELPSEIWEIILSKVKTMDILENVQKVCMLFRNICKQPSMYATIDMSIPVAYGITKIPIDIHALTCHAINRSIDRLSGASDIYIEYFCEAKTFKYIGGRCKTLKKLRLGHLHNFPSEALIEAIKRLPLLEEVQFRNCHGTRGVIEGVGHACPSLKSFGLTEYSDRFLDDYLDDYVDQYPDLDLDQYFYSRDAALAMAISSNMPNLRRLTINGNGMGNRDLEVILDGCPFLEYLDLRGCRSIYLSGNLGKRCEGIKHFRFLDDPIEDFVAEKELWNEHNRVQYPSLVGLSN